MNIIQSLIVSAIIGIVGVQSFTQYQPLFDKIERLECSVYETVDNCGADYGFCSADVYYK